jgi:hypothetical protein
MMLRIRSPLRGYCIWVAIWHCQEGTARLSPACLDRIHITETAIFFSERHFVGSNKVKGDARDLPSLGQTQTGRTSHPGQAGQRRGSQQHLLAAAVAPQQIGRSPASFLQRAALHQLSGLATTEDGAGELRYAARSSAAIHADDRLHLQLRRPPRDGGKIERGLWRR